MAVAVAAVAVAVAAVAVAVAVAAVAVAVAAVETNVCDASRARPFCRLVSTPKPRCTSPGSVEVSGS